MEQEAFIKNFLRLAPSIFHPQRAGWETCQANGVPLSLLIDLTPHALSGVSWCLSALSALSNKPAVDAAQIQTYISACIPYAAPGIATHPSEDPSTLGNLAAITLTMSLNHLNAPLPAELQANVITKILAAHYKSLRTIDYEIVRGKCRRFERLRPPPPLMNITLTPPDNMFGDEIDLRIIYSGLISTLLAKALASQPPERVCTHSCRQDKICGGWKWGDTWRHILSEEQRAGLLRTVALCQCPFTGGFGRCPGGEEHGGYTYCAVSCISVLCGWGEDCTVDVDKLKEWLRERCLPSGGMNGRSGKAADICYSFWVAAAWLNLGESLTTLPFADKRVAHILSCMHKNGGISKSCSDAKGSLLFNDSSDAEPDPFHTCFGLIALSLHLHCEGLKGAGAEHLQLNEMDSFTALPASAVGSVMGSLLRD